MKLKGLQACNAAGLPQEFIRLRFGLQPLFHSFFTFSDIIFQEVCLE